MSSDVSAFQDVLTKARFVAVLTGAGISAESGIPTFRGAGGLWRNFEAQEVASPHAWERDPGLVWEFYNYRRTLMREKRPNAGHYALAELERKLYDAGRRFHLVTQNIDDLHLDAGTQHVTRLHGSIWQVRCTGCYEVYINRDVPITPAFEGTGDPEEADPKKFEAADLPRCPIEHCRGILRPNVVWFGEALDHNDLDEGARAAMECDLFLVIGTSAVVHPAAQLVPVAKNSGAAVAEINAETTQVSELCDYTFHGNAGEWLPKLFGLHFDT